MCIGDSVSEPLIAQGGITHRGARSVVIPLLEQVGLQAEHYTRYPHEFSGGQLQRVGIARALSTGPHLIVCDEPVAALDLSIRSQILNLLIDLQKAHGLTYLFITHDLSMVRVLANRVVVMYGGRVVEEAPTQQIFDSPTQTYTRALLQAIPIADPTRRHLTFGTAPTSRNAQPECQWVEMS
jgi:ABC-type oligopeptide transport system ATPase subunit